MRAYIRTCQECGNRQQMKPPAKQRSEGWRSAKCRRCKSEALDYGSWQEVDSALKPLLEEQEQT